VRAAGDHLDLCRYHVPQRAIWPEIMERINRMPSLLYRFLRRGNVGTLADDVMQALAAGDTRLAISPLSWTPRSMTLPKFNMFPNG
jgi:hypothetical protein